MLPCGWETHGGIEATHGSEQLCGAAKRGAGEAVGGFVRSRCTLLPLWEGVISVLSKSVSGVG